MANAQSKLDILIAAKNSASPALKQVQGDLKSMDAAAGALSKGLGGIGAGVGIAGMVALAGAAVSTAASLSEEAAAMRRVELAARTLAGSQEQVNALLVAYKSAIGGAVTDGEAMARISSLQAIGFADSASELERFVTASRGASLATGNEVGYVISQLQLAIANQSTMRLDQIGLGVTEVKDRIKELKDANHGLTEEQAYQEAILGRLIEKYGKIAGSTEAGATGVEKLQTILRQMREDTAEAAAGPIDIGANLLTVYLQGQIEMLKNYTNALESAWVAAMNFVTGGHEVTSATLAMAQAEGQADAITHNLTFGLTNLGAAGHVAADGLTAAELKAANLTTRLAGLKAQSDAAISALAGIESSALSRLESAASGAVGAGMGAGNVAEIYTENAERIRGQIKAMNDLGLSDEYVMFKSQELADSAASDFTIYTEAAREASRATGEIADSLTDAEQAAKQAFDNIKGMAEGVLSGALNTGVASADSILESMGLREDAINEDARRLADVAVKGFDSPWADYFRASRPGLFDDMFFGDIKSVAAQQLKDFEDGLNPELIDRGRAKERIKRMITGDANMAELATEIAGELAAEMGVPLQQALASAQGALGVGGSQGGAGTDAARSFNDGAMVGLEESGGGATFVAGYTNQIRSSFSLLRTAGQDAAKAWGDSFYGYASEHLSPALIDLLATLITPAVQGKIAQQGSLTGANNN